MSINNNIRTILRQSLSRMGLRVSRISALPTGFSIAKDFNDDGSAAAVKCIFDVGANIGQMALHLHEQFPRAHIYSFEPVRSTFEALKKNTSSISAIHIVNMALGETETVETIYLQESSVFNSLNKAVNTADVSGRSETVNVSTVDTFCDQNGIDRIDLLKIDTEGYDLNVLHGAAQMLAANKISYVLTEVSFAEENQRNVHFSKMHSFMTGNGFKLRGMYNQSTNNRGYIVYADALYRLML